jgi:ectoine hydroxylase-related dioxygenase (phytanoyl-CoA dioxygenase family)
MTKLTTLPGTASTEEILAVIKEDGAVVLRDLIASSEVDRLLDETRPYIDATRRGADAFTGFQTTRTGALVARSSACRDLILNGSVLEAARQFLAPYCARIQLHLGQIIRLMPGQPQQEIHRDRWAWGTYLKEVEPQFNTIWAITDFSCENGATHVAPGSTSWPDARRPKPEEVVQAEMSRGSALLYTGSVFHGGGQNRSAGRKRCLKRSLRHA